MNKLQLLRQQLQEKKELFEVTRNEIKELKDEISKLRYAPLCGCEICIAELAIE